MGLRSIHPFPARMAPDIALDAIPENHGVNLTVLDPMCGSGTVLAAALKRGHNAIGVDIDPLAVMMSTLAVTPVDTDAFLDWADQVVEEARFGHWPSPWGEDTETDRFVDFWFGSRQKEQLRKLVGAISELKEHEVRLALNLAVSRIIVTKSPQASLAADTSHSRPHRVQADSEYDVYAGFIRSAKQLARMLGSRELNGNGTVHLGDARELHEVQDGQADLSVTSPPYLNALDYLRGHKLALVWFGHRVSDLRVRRSASIGSERALGAPASKVASEIIDLIRKEAIDQSTLKLPMLERFATDCIGFADQLARKLAPKGRLVLVVGNSTLRGNYIKNDQIALMALKHAGFILEDRRVRPIPANSRYMAINTSDTDSRMSKRMRDEVVLVLQRQP